jgi:hypothetical protein
MNPLTKISIFLGILTVDLVFFIPIRQFFREAYESVISSTSYYTHIPVETTTSLFVICGYVVALVCVLLVLYFIYSAVKTRAWRGY